MKLWSAAWHNGEAIPERFAAGRIAADGGVCASDNLSPPLAWRDLPAGARSLALICHDFDMPVGADAGEQPGHELPAELPRRDFFHWVLVDLPPTAVGFDEGQCSRSFVAGGKPAQGAPAPARQGLNDFGDWFAGDPRRAGRYLGYDGPLPPRDDSLVHHYVFTLYALGIDRLPVDGDFTGTQVRLALAGHVLGAATLSGTYTLNPRLRGG